MQDVVSGDTPISSECGRLTGLNRLTWFGGWHLTFLSCKILEAFGSLRFNLTLRFYVLYVNYLILLYVYMFIICILYVYLETHSFLCYILELKIISLYNLKDYVKFCDSLDIDFSHILKKKLLADRSVQQSAKFDMI